MPKPKPAPQPEPDKAVAERAMEIVEKYLNTPQSNLTPENHEEVQAALKTITQCIDERERWLRAR